MSPYIASEVLEIVEEDILRIMGEENKRISLDFLKSKIRVSDICFHKAVEGLGEKGLIFSKPDLLELTEDGQKKAKDIIEKHLVIENYFKKTRDEKEAHEAAHVIEHYISREAIKNIKRLSTFKKEDIPLVEVESGREVMISDIIFPEFGLFERIVSLGIFPGGKVKIMYKIPDGFVVNVNHKKIALSKDIAKNIEVLK